MTLHADLEAAIAAVRNAELFQDGLAADMHSAGIKTLEAAYIAGRDDALDELSTRLATLRAGVVGEDAIPPELFDGFAVLDSLPPHRRMRTSAENVADTLDAVVALIRKRQSAALGRTDTGEG